MKMTETYPETRPNFLFSTVVELSSRGLSLGSIITQVWMPIEVVVDRPTFVTPKVARVYTAQMQSSKKLTWENIWWHDKSWVRYDVLSSLPGFHGTGYCIQGYLVEVWDDHGDDGHTDYQLIGYRLVAMMATVLGQLHDVTPRGYTLGGSKDLAPFMLTSIDSHEWPEVWTQLSSSKVDTAFFPRMKEVGNVQPLVTDKFGKSK